MAGFAPAYGGAVLIFWWLNHNRLKLVLEYNHPAVAELDGLAGHGGRSRIRRESAGEAINVVGATALNK